MNRTIVRTVEVSFAVVLLLVAVFEGRYLILSSLGRRAEAQGDAQAALQWYEQADDEWFSRDMHLSRAQILISRSMYDEADHALDAYQSQNAIDYRLWKLRARIALEDGRVVDAARALQIGYLGARYNDVEFLRLLLQVIAISGSKDMQVTRQDIEALVPLYHQAILRNAHFITLSANADQFIVLIEDLNRIAGGVGDRFRAVQFEVREAMRKERANLAARKPGFLW